MTKQAIFTPYGSLLFITKNENYGKLTDEGKKKKAISNELICIRYGKGLTEAKSFNKQSLECRVKIRFQILLARYNLKELYNDNKALKH